MHHPSYPLQLSTIALKQPHYLPQPTLPNFPFSLQPITHQPQTTQKRHNLPDLQEKMLMRQKELKERREMLEKSERVRRDLLLRKIAAKNQRWEGRVRIGEGKENNRREMVVGEGSEGKVVGKCKERVEMKGVQAVDRHRQCAGGMMHRFEPKNVQKIYVNQPKVPFSSTKGFSSLNKSHQQQSMRRTSSSSNQQFKQIKLKGIVKLPQLNPLSSLSSAHNPDFPIQPAQQPQPSPFLKVHDPRYFGIQENTQDYEKLAKSLLKQIRNKYWCYDSLDVEEVYDNFEGLLLGEGGE